MLLKCIYETLQFVWHVQYTQTHKVTHACTHTHRVMHAHMHAHTESCMHICMHTQSHACTHACTHRVMHASTHTQSHAHTHARARARTHTLTHTQTYSKDMILRIALLNKAGHSSDGLLVDGNRRRLWASNGSWSSIVTFLQQPYKINYVFSAWSLFQFS